MTKFLIAFLVVQILIITMINIIFLNRRNRIQFELAEIEKETLLKNKNIENEKDRIFKERDLYAKVKDHISILEEEIKSKSQILLELKSKMNKV